jgi:hypothetical protein
MARRLSQECQAAIMRAPFALSDADELATLVRNAGFEDIAIQQRVGTVRFPSVERLVLSYIAGSPLAGPVSQANEAARGGLIADAKNALEKYACNGAILPHSRPLVKRTSVKQAFDYFESGSGTKCEFAAARQIVRLLGWGTADAFSRLPSLLLLTPFSDSLFASRQPVRFLLQWMSRLRRFLA